MKKIEVKKGFFLKNAKSYALHKKEHPVKLPMPPDTISALKVKFTFAKVEEVTLAPRKLSFFKERLGIKTKARATDSDFSKTYYVGYTEALLQELAQSDIYVGQTVEDKLNALSSYVEAVRGGKIIIEVIPKAAFTVSIGIEERESLTEGSDRALSSLIESPSLDLLTETGQNSYQSREDVEKYKKKIEEQGFIIEGLEAKFGAYQKAAAQGAAKDRGNALGIAQLKEALEQSRLEITGRLRALEEEMVRLRALPPKGKETEDKQKEEEKEEEAVQSPPVTEAIRQWVSRLAASRNGLVTAPLCNKGGEKEETLPRFLAIAKLEREKAAHFSNTSDPWLKEEALAIIKRDCYKDDLKCLSLYQNLPPELKRFAVTFAFWEMAHHNRFYRNALRTVLNGGRIPETVDADQTDILLKLLHYTDATRILMGHYGYIAQRQFDMDLFITQDETIARFHGGENGEGIPPDICRNIIESTLFM